MVTLEKKSFDSEINFEILLNKIFAIYSTKYSGWVHTHSNKYFFTEPSIYPLFFGKTEIKGLINYELL